MSARETAGRAARAAALLAWAALAFWTFSFAFSDSYFRYNLASRLPPFLAAFAGAVAMPVSAYLLWRRVERQGLSRLGAWLLHCLVAAACVLPLAVTAAVLSRLPGPFHLSGDDAMGVGIDFLILVGVAIVSALVLGLALLARRRFAARAS